jgi:hypothetical protein
MIFRRRGSGKSKKIVVSPNSNNKNYKPIKSNDSVSRDSKKPLPAHKWDGKTINNLMVVGYYTINTPYEQEAKKLISSLNKFNITHDVIGIPNKGGWQANTRYKATFMLEMLDKHKDHNLLYVDCDAVFHTYPTLFRNYECDVAVRWQDFRWRQNECLSGTIFMANNQKTRSLCRRWESLNKKTQSNKANLEQWNLGEIIKDHEKTNGLISKNLPAEYTFIFDIMRQIYPNAIPVIEHFQASRKNKRRV